MSGKKKIINASMDLMNTSQFFGRWDEDAAFLESWEREFSYFPESIPGIPGKKAFGMDKTKLETELQIDTDQLTWRYSQERIRYCSEQVAYLLQVVKKLGQEITGTISELRHLTLDFEYREKLNIPLNADMFCWANPIQQRESIDNEKLFFSNLGMHDFDVQFLMFGGFMYFKKNELIRCNCIVPSNDSGLTFGPPNSFSCLRWHREFLTKINERKSLVTIENLREKGATHFCWILPGELKGCPHGGFLYLFEERPEKNRYFGLVGATVNADAFRRNWEEAIEEKLAREGYQALLEIINPKKSEEEEFKTPKTPEEESPRNSETTWELPEFPNSLPGSGSIAFEAMPTLLAGSMSMDVNFTEGKWCNSHLKVSGTISRRHPVTIPAKQRVPVNIPSEASSFCWANPAAEIRETNREIQAEKKSRESFDCRNPDAAESQAENKSRESSDFKTSELAHAESQTEKILTPEEIFFHFGGFMYFNKAGDLIACNCIVPSNNPGFLFGPPKILDSQSKVQTKFLEELVKKKQLNNITLPHLLEAGARQFCWLLPEEIKGCSFGGFLYLFEDKTMNRYFSLMAVGDAKDSKACWDKEIAEINASKDFTERFKNLQKVAEEKANDGMLPQIFLCAAKTGQMDLINALISKTDERTKGEALIEAASKGHTDVCGFLIEFRPNESRLVGSRDEKGMPALQSATANRFWELCLLFALQYSTEQGFWETCLLLYKKTRTEEKERIFEDLLPTGKKKLLYHAYFEKDKPWGEIYDTLLSHGKESLCDLDETALISNSIKPWPWFVETALSLLQSKQNTKQLSRLKLDHKEKNKLLEWEIQNRAHEKKHQEACQILIEEGADFASVLNGVLKGVQEIPERVEDGGGLVKVEYLMEALAKSFVRVDLELSTVQGIFKLYHGKDVHGFLKVAPYTCFILFLSDSFFPKDNETTKVIPAKLSMVKISKVIHTKVVSLCDDSPNPIFFLIKVAAALAKRGEERTIHQGEYLLLRDHFVAIAQDAMKIDEFNNIDNTFQALGGEVGQLLSFLKEEKPINYAMRYNLNEIICSPHVQELLQYVWGTPRLWHALSPFEFQWSKSISTHLTLQDTWSFEMYRKIPCLRALVGAFLKFLFLGLCYVALFSEDLGVQRRLSFVFMVVSIGYSVERRFGNKLMGKVDGRKRKFLLLMLIFVWTGMIWADHPSVKYCNIIMAVTCAVIALYSLEFLKYFETFGFMMVAFTEIWQDFEIFAIFYLFLLFSFAILFTFTDTEIEEFKDLPTALISLVSGSFGNFDLAIFYAESNQALHTFGQVLFVLYLFVVYVILLNLLTALLTVTFTRNQEKKTEKFFLLKANFVRNFASLEDDNCGLGDKLLPAPLCIFDILLDHQNYPRLSGGVLFLFDFVLTVIVVIPSCWLLVVYLILNRWDECMRQIEKLLSFGSSGTEQSKSPVRINIEKVIVHVICFCSVITSPLWFPFLVVKWAIQNDTRLHWDWNPPEQCFVYNNMNKKGTEHVKLNNTDEENDLNKNDEENDVNKNDEENDEKNWKPFLRKKMKGLLEIFKTKTEKGEGLYWISKEINRDGLLREMKANNDKILQEQTRMLEEIKDKIDKRLGNVELNLSQIDKRLTNLEQQK